jgi:hypothetical protein
MEVNNRTETIMSVPIKLGKNPAITREIQNIPPKINTTGIKFVCLFTRIVGALISGDGRLGKAPLIDTKSKIAHIIDGDKIEMGKISNPK